MSKDNKPGWWYITLSDLLEDNSKIKQGSINGYSNFDGNTCMALQTSAIPKPLKRRPINYKVINSDGSTSADSYNQEAARKKMCLQSGSSSSFVQEDKISTQTLQSSNVSGDSQLEKFSSNSYSIDSLLRKERPLIQQINIQSRSGEKEPDVVGYECDKKQKKIGMQPSLNVVPSDIWNSKFSTLSEFMKAIDDSNNEVRKASIGVPSSINVANSLGSRDFLDQGNFDESNTNFWVREKLEMDVSRVYYTEKDISELGGDVSDNYSEISC